MLEKALKRELTIGADHYMLTISPDGLKLVPKGKRNGVELQWPDLVSGEAALAVALNASARKTRRRGDTHEFVATDIGDFAAKTASHLRGSFAASDGHLTARSDGINKSAKQGSGQIAHEGDHCEARQGSLADRPGWSTDQAGMGNRFSRDPARRRPRCPASNTP